MNDSVVPRETDRGERYNWLKKRFLNFWKVGGGSNAEADNRFPNRLPTAASSSPLAISSVHRPR